jgi:hypothetical protein
MEAIMGVFIWEILNKYTKILKNKDSKKILFIKNYSFFEIKELKALILSLKD